MNPRSYQAPPGPQEPSGLLSCTGTLMMLLSVVSLIVAGLWLVVLREWRLVLTGGIVLLVSHFLAILLMMPRTALASPGLKLLEDGKHVAATVAAAVSTLYLSAVFVGWGVVGASLFRAISGSAPPLVVTAWSFGVVTNAWVTLTQQAIRANGGDEEIRSTFFLQVGFLCGLLFFSSLKGTAIALFVSMSVYWLMAIYFFWRDVQYDVDSQRS